MQKKREPNEEMRHKNKIKKKPMRTHEHYILRRHAQIRKKKPAFLSRLCGCAMSRFWFSGIMESRCTTCGVTGGAPFYHGSKSPSGEGGGGGHTWNSSGSVDGS